MALSASDLLPFCVNIVSKTQYSTRPLALATNLADRPGQLVAASLDPAQASQLWLPTYAPVEISGILQQPDFPNPTLVNVLSGMAISYKGLGDGSPLMQVAPSAIVVSDTWGPGGDSTYVALRPATDADQNVRIPEQAMPMSGVTTDGWAGGKDNEVWTCVQPTIPSSDPSYAYLLERLTSILPALLLSITDGDNFALSDTDATGYPIVIDTPDVSKLAQQWVLLQWRTQSVGNFQTAMVLVNASTGKALTANGEGVPLTNVLPGQPQNASLWQATPEWRPEGYVAFKNVATSDYVNVTENRTTPGQWVSTWHWDSHDPQNYDSWHLARVQHGKVGR